MLPGSILFVPSTGLGSLAYINWFGFVSYTSTIGLNSKAEIFEGSLIPGADIWALEILNI